MSEEIRFSLSSEEDVNDFLSQLSYIYEGKEKDEEMLSIYLDFIKVLENMETKKCLTVVHDIQVGKIKKDFKLNTNQQGAKLLGLKNDKFESALESEIEDVVRVKKNLWLGYINEKYRNTYWNNVFESNNNKDESNIIDKINSTPHKVSFDTNKICLRGVNEVREKEIIKNPQKEKDLLPLVEFEKELKEKISKLESEGKKGSPECRKLTTTRIATRKDINIIRRSYGEVLGSQNSSGKRTFVTYGEENPYFNDILKAHEDELEKVKEDSFNEFLKEEKLNQIKKVAKNELTNRQYIIFEFYYFNGMTQQEIADVMGVSKQMINKDIPRIISKLKSKME